MSTDEPLLPNSVPDGESTPQSKLLPKVAAAMLCFMVQGVCASTTGALIPHLEDHYSLTDGQVSVIFIATPTGYALASWLTHRIQARFGQRGVTFLGPLLQTISALGCSLHPQFPVFISSAILGGLGAALTDASLCSWAAGSKNSNFISGLLHGSFSTGAAIGAPLVGTFVTILEQHWFRWYHVLSGLFTLVLVAMTFAFGTETAERNREQVLATNEFVSHHGTSFFSRLAVWMCAAFLLVYVGIETSISGWVVVFMDRTLHSSTLVSTVASSGFWLGMSVGRVALSIATEKMGVARSNTLYILGALLASVLLAGTNSPIWSILVFSLLGFFCGPLLPSSMIQMTSLLPRQFHLPAVSFVMVIGQFGGALMPFGLGVLSEIRGIQVFKVLVPLELLMGLGIWILFCRLPMHS